MNARNITAALIILAGLLPGDCISGTKSGGNTENQQQPVLRGICFGPYRANEDPNCGVYPTVGEIREELQFIKKANLAPKIRTYSCLNTLSNVPAMCQELGIECWPGAWLGENQCANEREIEALIQVGKRHLQNCPVLIVGNEVLLRRYGQSPHERELGKDELMAVIKRVRNDTGSKVAYAEIGSTLMRFPEVADSVDVILVHLYPFWDYFFRSRSKSTNGPAYDLLESWKQIRTNFPNTRIVIGETGWPSAGEAAGDATPTERDQATYLRDFLKISEENDIDYFYFSLFSESWKAGSGEHGCGANWGLFTEYGQLRPSLKGFFPLTAQSGMNRSAGAIPQARGLQLPAYVYRGACSPENRFFPTFFMGDSDDLKIDEACHEFPSSECIKISYSLTGRSVEKLQPGQRAMVGWAGIYWVGPYINHQGKYPGYFLKGARKLTFRALGAKGGEKVTFKVGGIKVKGEPFRDSFGPIQRNGSRPDILTNQWSQYSINLDRADMSSLLGGFCITVAEKDNPHGCIFYLNDIVIVGDTP